MMFGGPPSGYGGMGQVSGLFGGALQGAPPRLGGVAPAMGAAGNSAPPLHGPSQEDVFGLLKDALTRRFKIDIENDSTIAGDESQEKQDRTDFIEAMTKFMEAWGPMVEREPRLAPLAGELLQFGTRSFRVARELEEMIEETANKLSAPDAMQQEGPDPKVQAEQVKLHGAQMKTQAEVQKSQMDAQTGQQEAQMKLQEIITQSQARIAEARMKLAAMEQAHGHKMAEAQMAHGAAMDEMALEQQRAQAAQAAQMMQPPKPPAWPVDQPGF